MRTDGPDDQSTDALVPPRGVVYVVAKLPRPGASKTRLCPPLRHDQAARLARAFLLDTLTTVRLTGFEARVICRDAVERASLIPLVGRLSTVHTQARAGLSDALESAFREGLSHGFEVVGVLGPDSPTLPVALVQEAFRAVAGGADVALGPCEDGGYYLLVARTLHPDLFRDIPWSTSAVAEITLDRCRALGLRVHRLPMWYDVDDAASLARLCAELSRSPATVAPHTRAALAQPRSDSPAPPPVPDSLPG